MKLEFITRQLEYIGSLSDGPVTFESRMREIAALKFPMPNVLDYFTIDGAGLHDQYYSHIALCENLRDEFIQTVLELDIPRIACEFAKFCYEQTSDGDPDTFVWWFDRIYKPKD